MTAEALVAQEVAPVVDPILSNPQFKELFSQFAQDTQSSVERANPESFDGASLNALDMVSQADSTEQLVGVGVQELSVENLLGLFVEEVPEDSPFGSFLDLFVGRNGARDQEDMGDN